MNSDALSTGALQRTEEIVCRFPARPGIPGILLNLGMSLVLIFLAITTFAGDPWGPFSIVLVLLCVVNLAENLSELFFSSYDVTARALIIRNGLFRHTVHLSAIKEISPSRKRFPRGFLSNQGLEIRRGVAHAEVYISPADPESFMNCLAEVWPALQRDGDRLIQRA